MNVGWDHLWPLGRQYDTNAAILSESCRFQSEINVPNGAGWRWTTTDTLVQERACEFCSVALSTRHATRTLHMDRGRLEKFIAEYPAAYAGFRAIFTSDANRHQTTAEKNEVPFIFSILFIPLLSSYIFVRRFLFLFTSLVGSRKSLPEPTSGHIFVMTSTHNYRTYAFEEVGAELSDRGEDVLFVCSPSASEYVEELSEQGFRTVSYLNLLKFVTFRDVLASIPRSINHMRTLEDIVADEYPDQSYRFVLNAIFLEFVKTLSFELVAGDEPTVHTYSLMPYQVRSTALDRLYVYQHGCQRAPEKPGEGGWAATTFFPVTILIWGEAWVANYEQLIHQKCSLNAVGSPWFDGLSELTSEFTPVHDCDVLFVGGSQTASEKYDTSYEEIVSTVVQACRDNGWSLAIKLHPVEQATWYEERGWEDYITEFEGIHEALISADVAVSHFSSAFVESLVVGTPVVLNEEWSFGLTRIRPIKGVSFVSTRKIEPEIERWITRGDSSERISVDNRLVNLGKSTERIANIVSTK